MNEAPPGVPESPPSVAGRRPSGRRILLWSALASMIVAALGCGVFFFLRGREGDVVEGSPRIENADMTEEALDAKDFSASNSVSIVLGERQSSLGLEHLATERDGRTAMGKLKGLRCRSFDLPPHSDGKKRSHGYLYFAIDPTFKSRGTNQVRIELEYYNEKRGVLKLQYHAHAASRSPQSTYKQAGPAVALDGAKEWETAAFHIRDGAFANAQNSGADFRFEVLPPELYVRRVTVTRETDDTPDERALQ